VEAGDDTSVTLVATIDHRYPSSSSRSQTMKKVATPLATE
jgi:hypothetical protein